jgi:hypothetical protein
MHVRPHMCLAPVCVEMLATCSIHRSVSFFRGFHILSLVLGGSHPSLLSLLQSFALEHYLSDLLEVKVDLVERSTLKPTIGRHILAEVVPV